MRPLTKQGENEKAERENDKMPLIAIMSLFFTGYVIVIVLMLGGKQVRVPKLEKLNVEEDFPVYYSNNNSLFPLLGIMAYLLLFLGIIGSFSTYGRGIGVLLLIIAVPLLISVVYKVRNAEEKKDRLLMTIRTGGLDLPSKGLISWEEISRVEIENDIRQNSHLVVYVMNKNRGNKIEKVGLPIQFSRFNPSYLKKVIMLYMKNEG